MIHDYQPVCWGMAGELHLDPDDGEEFLRPALDCHHAFAGRVFVKNQGESSQAAGEVRNQSRKPCYTQQEGG